MTVAVEPRVLTVDEAAQVLRCHPQTVRRLVARGELRGLRLGDLVRIPREALEEFLVGKVWGTGEERHGTGA